MNNNTIVPIHAAVEKLSGMAGMILTARGRDPAADISMITMITFIYCALPKVDLFYYLMNLFQFNIVMFENIPWNEKTCGFLRIDDLVDLCLAGEAHEHGHF